MKVLILSNGDIDDYSKIQEYIKDDSYIICADGGVRHSSYMDITPNLIVGDLDSASNSIVEKFKKVGTQVCTFPTEKDATDTQIAVDRAIDMGASEIVLAGALGDRWDHSYANVMLLYRIAQHDIDGYIIDTKNIITISNSILKLYGERGQLLSLLPFGGEVHIESTSGLKYPIFNKILYMDYPLGVSNVLTSSKAQITIKAGWVLAILAQD